jgi:hypothetical protein
MEGVMVRSFLRIAAMAAAIALASGVLPSGAQATQYTIDFGNSALSGYTGPFATVDVSLVDSKHASITFTSLTNSGNIYLFGDGGSVAVNVDATSWTLGPITGSNAGTGFTPGPWIDSGAGSEDGFGSFNQTVNSFDGFSHSSDLITLALENTGGTWSDAASVLTPNADGHVVAAHIFVTVSPADASNGALVTGFATTTPVPIPPALALFASGLAGLGFVARRRRPKGGVLS